MTSLWFNLSYMKIIQGQNQIMQFDNFVTVQGRQALELSRFPGTHAE